MNFAEQEKFDAQIYGSNRAMHEHLLHIVLDKVKQGEWPVEQIACLTDTYNNLSEDCQRLVGRIRRVENALDSEGF